MNRREIAAGASLVVGAVAVGLLVALISLLGARTRFEPVPVGDQLGQDNGETFAEYVERAEASLDDAPGDAPAFALVTFAGETTPEEASAVLEPVGRVDAVIPPDAPLQPIGEPKKGRDRTEIFRIAVDGDVAGAVVRDTGDALRALSANERIAAVEALPPDAVWGAFGVRPVNPQTP
ncbi:hypothetical protein [Corynebacterium appendicis]|uniref:hypothetical protein n=1 Tax=Corynebacterium appendicis TaxID=163202 RepID=UPI00223C3599|nr:hypothetical protein [Corynebacterium appendicis]MCT1683496.1 hypothetical protein [Corynebacterium appendicis]